MTHLHNGGLFRTIPGPFYCVFSTMLSQYAPHVVLVTHCWNIVVWGYDTCYMIVHRNTTQYSRNSIHFLICCLLLHFLHTIEILDLSYFTLLFCDKISQQCCFLEHAYLPWIKMRMMITAMRSYVQLSRNIGIQWGSTTKL